MNQQEQAVIEAAKELVKFRAPSLEKILARHEYRHEAEKVKNLVAAVESLEKTAKP